MQSVLVIGAGVGGIATAALLARDGYNVTVVEKNEQPGGRCGRLVVDGHHFVTGPTLFLIPELFSKIFTDLGERMDDHLDLRRVDPSYHLHFDDGSELYLTSDLTDMKVQLEAIESGSFNGFLRYIEDGLLHYKLSLPFLMERNFRKFHEFFNLNNVLLVLRIKGLVKHYDHVGNYFKDPRLKAAFTFQDMYVGLSPDEAPALFSLLQYAEFADGVWFPMGGMYSFVEALTGIAQKNGTQFLYNSPVLRININGRQATGVTLENGEQIEADIVVANADLPYVFRDLLQDDNEARRLDRKKYSCSAIMYCWGTDKQYPQLETHNLFLAGDYMASFECIFDDLRLPDEPSFYVHAPARMDPSLAPEGQDTLIVMVPVGHIDDCNFQDWDEIQDRTRRIVLQRMEKMGVKDLGDHIKFERCYSPCDWQARFNLVKGATHGLSHNLMQMGYLRPHNRHNRYRNLYFVGASTHPGTGVPTVLVSARLVAERILQEYGTQ